MRCEEGERREERQQRLAVRGVARSHLVARANAAETVGGEAKLGLDVAKRGLVDAVRGVGAGIHGREDGQDVALALGVVAPHVLVEMQIGSIWHLGELDGGIAEGAGVYVEKQLDQLADGGVGMILLNGDKEDSDVDSAEVAERVLVEAALLHVSLVGGNHLREKADRCKGNPKCVVVAHQFQKGQRNTGTIQ